MRLTLFGGVWPSQLEAERAGARVTLESARAAGDGPIAELMRTIHRDEARWCGMLLRHLERAGEAVSSKVGAFYGKAMAIADLGERITFLNRGQAWVVRKLRVACELIDVAARFPRRGRDGLSRSNSAVKCAQCWGAGNFSLMHSSSAAWMRPRSRLGGAKSACA